MSFLAYIRTKLLHLLLVFALIYPFYTRKKDACLGASGRIVAWELFYKAQQ